MPSIKLTEIELGFLKTHYEQELADALQYVDDIRKFLVKLGAREKEAAAEAPKKGRRGRPAKKAVAEEKPAPVKEERKKPGRKPRRKKPGRKPGRKAAPKAAAAKAAAPAAQKAAKPAAKKAARKRVRKPAAKKAAAKPTVPAPKPAEVTPPVTETPVA